MTYKSYNTNLCLNNQNTWCEVEANNLMLGMYKYCDTDSIACLNHFMEAQGPWRNGTLGGQKNCPNFASNLEGGNKWGTC